MEFPSGWTDAWMTRGMDELHRSDSRICALYHNAILFLIHLCILRTQHKERHSNYLAYYERTKDWNHKYQDFF